MQLSTEKFLEKLDNLATISPVAVELIHKLADIHTSREEIVNLTERDEVIYANLFKYIKSAAFIWPHYPNNTQQAIEVLGQHGLRDLIFMITARGVFLDLKLWQKSLLMAFLAKSIAEKHNYDLEYSSDIYISTLMCNFGQMIFKTFYQQEYSKIREGISYADLLIEEKCIFGLNSLDLSYEIAKSYQLPINIINLINSQRLALYDPNFLQGNAIIYTAQSIINNECLDYEDIEEAIDKDLLQLHKLETVNIDTALLKQCKNLANAFS